MIAVTGALARATLALAFLPGTVQAQVTRMTANVDDRPPQASDVRDGPRGWLDIGIGGGWTHLESADSDRRGSFALDFGGGLWVREEIGMGARLGGWTLEGFNLGDPSEGESLSEAFAVVRLRPFGGSPLVIDVEGGWASYTANAPSVVLREGDGWGARIGVAWDVDVSDSWSMAPTLVGSWGKVNPDFAPEPSFSYSSVGAVFRVEWSW
jgi:hypothetical protein